MIYDEFTNIIVLYVMYRVSNFIRASVFKEFCEAAGGRVGIGSWKVFLALFDGVGDNFFKVIVIMKKSWILQFIKNTIWFYRKVKKNWI